MIINIDTDKDRGICRVCKERILQTEYMVVLGFGSTMQTLHGRCEEELSKAMARFGRNLKRKVWQGL